MRKAKLKDSFWQESHVPAGSASPACVKEPNQGTWEILLLPERVGGIEAVRKMSPIKGRKSDGLVVVRKRSNVRGAKGITINTSPRRKEAPTTEWDALLNKASDSSRKSQGDSKCASKDNDSPDR